MPPGTAGAYVFRRVPGGEGGAWVEEAKLTAADGRPSDLFGRSVSLSGDVALVGARFEDERGTDAGAAYVFRRISEGEGGAWVQEAKLTAADGEAGDFFGRILRANLT